MIDRDTIEYNTVQQHLTQNSTMQHSQYNAINPRSIKHTEDRNGIK